MASQFGTASDILLHCSLLRCELVKDFSYIEALDGESFVLQVVGCNLEVIWKNRFYNRFRIL